MMTSTDGLIGKLTWSLTSSSDPVSGMLESNQSTALRGTVCLYRGYPANCLPLPSSLKDTWGRACRRVSVRAPPRSRRSTNEFDLHPNQLRRCESPPRHLESQSLLDPLYALPMQRCAKL